MTSCSIVEHCAIALAETQKIFAEDCYYMRYWYNSFYFRMLLNNRHKCTARWRPPSIKLWMQTSCTHSIN